MKAWQCGYDLDWLKEKENDFADYNKVVLSPFAQMKKNKIAELFSKDKLLQIDNIAGETILPTSVASNAVHVRVYRDVDLGIRQKGERVIDNPVGDKELLIKTIKTFKENIWMNINSNYKLGNQIAKKLKFEKIGIKVNSFSDIINVYVKQNTDKKMDIRLISPLEATNITRVGKVVDVDLIGMKNRILSMGDIFANHYSNYNKKKSWSAVALRGFSPAPTFIEKPTEMSDKWQKENTDIEFEIQDTSLKKLFEPAISHILDIFPCKKERVRLMKLEPNGGILDRHTDQTDKDLGIIDGKIMRLHIPIITSLNVAFSSWNWEGKEDVRYMREGEIWYLDIRKPHKAVNTGDSARVHLVVDCIANQELRDIIE